MIRQNNAKHPLYQKATEKQTKLQDASNTKCTRNDIILILNGYHKQIGGVGNVVSCF